MAHPSTLYRFRISVSDIERSFYGELDFRAAMHPSESEDFLLTRIIAYALNYEDGLQFTTGLSNPDEPAIQLLGSNGEILKWIDIGSPSTRRLHKSSKASKSVRIYTHKSPEHLIKEASGEAIHRAEEIEIFAVDEKFLRVLAPTLKRDNVWNLIMNDGELVITMGEDTFMTTVRPFRIEK